jgi:PAS domain S-box-containing protein
MKKPKSAPIPDNVTEIILESISDGVFTVDHEWRIMSFNRAAETITGIPRAEAIGRHCWEVFRSNMCEEACALKADNERRHLPDQHLDVYRQQRKKADPHYGLHVRLEKQNRRGTGRRGDLPGSQPGGSPAQAAGRPFSNRRHRQSQ